VATVELKGIWGLEQLDNTGIATWKLGLILMGGALLLGEVLIPILGGLNPGSSLAPLYTPRVLSVIPGGFIVSIGVNIAFALFWARNTEADLHLLSVKEDSVNESITRLQPKNGILLLCILVTIIANHSLLPVVNVVVFNMTLSESISAIHSSGLVVNVLQYPILFLNALASAVMLTVLVTQSKSLVQVARFIKIDIFQLECYSAIANPAIRLIVFTLAVFGLLPFVILFVGAQSFTSAAVVFALILLLFLFPLIALYTYPILILRNRIRDEKQQEMDIVFRALEGDVKVIDTARIKQLGLPMSAGDLLTYKMFIESRWDWPIASHVQKLILFGLLPPITWVFAAVIENIIY